MCADHIRSTIVHSFSVQSNIAQRLINPMCSINVMRIAAIGLFLVSQCQLLLRLLLSMVVRARVRAPFDRGIKQKHEQNNIKKNEKLVHPVGLGSRANVCLWCLTMGTQPSRKTTRVLLLVHRIHWLARCLSVVCDGFSLTSFCTACRRHGMRATR